MCGDVPSGYSATQGSTASQFPLQSGEGALREEGSMRDQSSYECSDLRLGDSETEL